jgi:hypothetical protein
MFLIWGLNLKEKNVLSNYKLGIYFKTIIKHLYIIYIIYM